MATAMISHFLSLPESLSGPTKLFMAPTDPVRESESVVKIRPAVGRTGLSLDYTWSFDGAGQEGSMLVVVNRKTAAAEIAWADTFHTGGGIMHLKGKLEGSGVIDVLGSYPVPGQADWGWRMTLSIAAGRLHIKMFNIMPEPREEFPAVEAVYAA